jgi:IS5 family transposase
MMHFEAAIDGAHIEANRVYADKGSGSQHQSAVSKKAKDQERNHASRVQEQTTLGTPEAGESIDQQKTLYCRTVFRHNQTLIQNGARQLLRYGKVNTQVIIKSETFAKSHVALVSMQFWVYL